MARSPVHADLIDMLEATRAADDPDLIALGDTVSGLTEPRRLDPA
jgi:hypothetical protein